MKLSLPHTENGTKPLTRRADYTRLVSFAHLVTLPEDHINMAPTFK